MKSETIKKIPKRLKKVEELFQVAEETLEKCQIPEDTDEAVDVEIVAVDETELSEIEDPETKLPRLFDLKEVRHDFILARRNLYKLMNKCQILMDGVTSFDITDMKGVQIESIALLANSITMQIQTVMRLYKDMASIEEMRIPPEIRGSNNTPTAEDDKTVYVGDSKSLIQLIKENK